MPGGRLVRGMARTAVVAGTATATHNAVNRRQAQKNVEAYGDAQEQYAEQTQQQAPPAAAPAAGGEEDTIAQLERLGQLKAQGILTDEEFAAQKAKVLGS